ncbi:hypothetical protein ACFL27_22765 [candidate division CSSED10-310 bacterium]|uniref:Cysteine synthase n=1 Tax=candidate division CSSED10-310 bacterium TaxID=2855610 RepID=A0ABV6Z3K0_UNCC1
MLRFLFETAGQMSNRLARELGVLVGVSGVANVRAALRIAEKPANKNKMIVTLRCDAGERYLSHWF